MIPIARRYRWYYLAGSCLAGGLALSWTADLELAEAEPEAEVAPVELPSVVRRREFPAVVPASAGDLSASSENLTALFEVPAPASLSGLDSFADGQPDGESRKVQSASFERQEPVLPRAVWLQGTIESADTP